MRRLLCLLKLHRYRKPSYAGGMRCDCGRVRYPLNWWTPVASRAHAGKPNEARMPNTCTLADLAELGLLGGDSAMASARARHKDGPVNIVFLTLANEDELRRFNVPGGSSAHVRPAMGRDRPTDLTLVHEPRPAGPQSI